MAKSPGPMSITFHDQHRTIIGYHGTTKATAKKLVAGKAFDPSENDDDWLGNGRYFWEYAPKQAWWWTQRYKKHEDAAVVGAVIRLGNCFDLLDPVNAEIARQIHSEMVAAWPHDQPLPENFRQHKKLDCAVFNFFYKLYPEVETVRGVYVPTQTKNRLWLRSWIYEQAHIQVCVRKATNILALWHVRKDGSYGVDDID